MSSTGLILIDIYDSISKNVLEALFFGEVVSSGGARDSMLPGHSQVNYLANQVKRKSLCHRATDRGI